MKNIFLMIAAALMLGVVYAGDMYEVPVQQVRSSPMKVTTTKIVVQNHPRYILPPPVGYVPSYDVYPRPVPYVDVHRRCYHDPRPVIHHQCPPPVHHHSVPIHRHHHHR